MSEKSAKRTIVNSPAIYRGGNRPQFAVVPSGTKDKPDNFRFLPSLAGLQTWSGIVPRDESRGY